MNRMITAAVLLAGGFLSDLAVARPADCLVQIEGRTLINGTCEFEAEPNGDFSVTLGSGVARVMVAGSREGRAWYEDKASGGPPIISDVRRNGGCWGESSTMRVCAWQPGQRPAAYRNLPVATSAAAAPAAPTARPGGMRVVSSRQVGPWTLSRLEGGGTWRCELERRYPDGGTLVFLATKPSPGNQDLVETGLRFGGAELQGMRGEIRVRPWGWPPESAQTAIADGNGFATMMDPPNDPGSSDAFSNAKELSILLPGGARLRYTLEGSNAGWKAVRQCAGF